MSTKGSFAVEISREEVRKHVMTLFISDLSRVSAFRQRRRNDKWQVLAGSGRRAAPGLHREAADAATTAPARRRLTTAPNPLLSWGSESKKGNQTTGSDTPRIQRASDNR